MKTKAQKQVQLEAIKQVFASLFNDRAITYRVHHGFLHADELGAFFEVAGVDHAGLRHVDEIRVTNIQRAVGIG